MAQRTITINKDYEALVPPQTEKEFITLKESIKENGQLYPIIVNPKGIILDGHCRMRACKELNIKPKVEVRDFNDSLLEKWFVVESNLNRRQLTTWQVAEIVLKFEPLVQQLARRNMSKGGKTKVSTNVEPLHTDKILAQKANTSTATLHKVRAILNANPSQDTLARLRAGKDRINKVYTEIQKQEKKKAFMSSPQKISFEGVPIKLFNRDFRTMTAEEIPDSSIDLIFTDPPYLEEYIPIYKDLGIFANRVLKDGGSLVSYIGQMWLPEIINHFQSAGLNYWWMFAIKMNGQSARMRARHAFQQWKPLLWFVKGEKLITPYYVWDSIEDRKQPDKVLHEWEQSPEPPERIIPRLTYEGGIICDPMMGSGTTGVATLKLKRQFIGVEIDKERFSVGERRIFEYLNENNTSASNVGGLVHTRTSHYDPTEQLLFASAWFDGYLLRLNKVFTEASA